MELILDTDPGVDDAMAYFYAHACGALNLVGVTTVFGNVTVSDATRNALWLVQSSAGSARVYQGAARPLQIPPNAPSSQVHGPRGFGTIEIEDPQGHAGTEDAADYLVRAARKAPGELTLCAVGPLTNVARAIEQDPDFVSNLHQLVIMGGALDVAGNVTPFAEANFWNDPHAANMVVNAPGTGRVVIVGLDVTGAVELTRDDFADVERASPIAGGFLRRIGDFYIDFYESRSGRPACSLHDPSAVIACHKPDLFKMEETALSVTVEGEKIGNMQRANRSGGRICHVCVGVDVDAVISEYMTTVSLNP